MNSFHTIITFDLTKSDPQKNTRNICTQIYSHTLSTLVIPTSQCFSRILFVKIPNRRHYPELYCDQIAALKAEVYALAQKATRISEDYNQVVGQRNGGIDREMRGWMG